MFGKLSSKVQRLLAIASLGCATMIAVPSDGCRFNADVGAEEAEEILYHAWSFVEDEVGGYDYDDGCEEEDWHPAEKGE